MPIFINPLRLTISLSSFWGTQKLASNASCVLWSGNHGMFLVKSKHCLADSEHLNEPNAWEALSGPSIKINQLYISGFESSTCISIMKFLICFLWLRILWNRVRSCAQHYLRANSHCSRYQVNYPNSIRTTTSPPFILILAFSIGWRTKCTLNIATQKFFPRGEELYSCCHMHIV